MLLHDEPTRHLEQPPALPLLIRPVRLADLPYVRWSFAEGHKDAPGPRSMPWRLYKRFLVPDLESALVHPSTELLGAHDASGAIVGWLAFARGRRVSAIHWVHTRWKLHGPTCPTMGDRDAVCDCGALTLRRRGVMTQLLDAARLGDRIAYTFKGGLPKYGKRNATPLDEKLLPWLARRGQHAAYVPWEEWIQ